MTTAVQALTYLACISYFVLCTYEALRRRTWKKNLKLKISAFLLGGSFGFFGISGLLGQPSYLMRQFVHTMLFIWGIALGTVKLTGRRKMPDGPHIILIFSLIGSLGAWWFFGVRALAFVALVALTQVFYLTATYAAAFPEVEWAVRMENAGTLIWMFEIYAAVAGLPSPDWLECVRVALFMAALAIIARKMTPDLLETRLQKKVVDEAFRI